MKYEDKIFTSMFDEIRSNSIKNREKIVMSCKDASELMTK